VGPAPGVIDALLEVLRSDDPAVANRSLASLCAGRPAGELLEACARLEGVRHRTDNLYTRVRALLFLSAIHRFELPRTGALPACGYEPREAYAAGLERRFEDAIGRLLAAQADEGPSEATSSALADAYRRLAFDTLAAQVRRSVREHPGQRWLFETRAPGDHPLRVRGELRAGRVLREATPVRMDLSHSGWSDIFFLAMDDPRGARVLNASVDLAVRGRDDVPRPPIETFLRVIEVPVMRLRSVDLDARADLLRVADAFDFSRDHLGLLRAGVIAGGIVPPGLEGVDAPMDALLEGLVGPGRGLELVTHVRGIPKGSRLAVSTNLLASILAVVMRATGQARALAGPLDDAARRSAVARAILGEWLGGSGGGWQDSAGLFGGLKSIEGVPAGPGDPEHGTSRGRLLPRHRVLARDELPEGFLETWRRSLVLVHGGMSQDVGPVLEMVTERYLLRDEEAWAARGRARRLYDEIVAALRAGDVAALGRATHENFFDPIQTIIPWANNLYTERLVERVRARFGERFLGFWMLGGMSGGGMGFLVDPAEHAVSHEAIGAILQRTKDELSDALPFAMDPVVYDFAIDEEGSRGELVGEDALPAATPRPPPPPAGAGDLDALLAEHGFDARTHEEVRAALRAGRIGLRENRLPPSTRVEDARQGDVREAGVTIDGRAHGAAVDDEARALGAEALRAGRVAVVTLAGGSGTRWTQGAGVVKALHPFCRIAGRYRSFLDVHRAKTRRRAREAGRSIPHVVTTSHLTHAPIARWAGGGGAGAEGAVDVAGARAPRAGAPDRPPGDARTDGAPDLLLSRGRAIGLRLVPTERDLRFAWQEQARQRLDEQAEKVRLSLQEALIAWAREAGEAGDYRDNVPSQCLHPVGHWYEVGNLLLNGTLATLLEARPALATLMLHNVDTVGADVDPGLLGLHLRGGAALTFEVVPRRHEDRGGGLARVDGELCLVESIALPREDDELRLSYYNSMTTWIDVDALLALFGLARAELRDERRVADAVRALAARLPTYVALKDVKKRWGHGHEDVFPVLQFERLWSDMSALPDCRCAYLAVPRVRGQQLKEPAQLDVFWRDGSVDVVEALGAWA